MKIDENSAREHPASGNEHSAVVCKYREKYYIQGSNWLTHRQIKKMLSERYPGYVLIKEIAWHEGARWFGNKNGSLRYQL